MICIQNASGTVCLIGLRQYQTRRAWTNPPKPSRTLIWAGRLSGGYPDWLLWAECPGWSQNVMLETYHHGVRTSVMKYHGTSLRYGRPWTPLDILGYHTHYQLHSKDFWVVWLISFRTSYTRRAWGNPEASRAQICARRLSGSYADLRFLGYGRSWGVMGCHVISWTIGYQMGYHRISSDIVGYHGMSQDLMG